MYRTAIIFFFNERVKVGRVLIRKYSIQSGRGARELFQVHAALWDRQNREINYKAKEKSRSSRYYF